MKTNSKLLNFLTLLFALSPIAYLLILWSSVPAIVVTRFRFDELIVKEQSRELLLFEVILLSVVAAGLYFLMRNLKKIDPLVKATTPQSGFHRLGFSVMVVLVLMNFFIVVTAVHAWEVSMKVVFVFIGLLLAVLGNYMNNLKRNYFAGFRLPWTLNDEDNWRRTHQVAGKLWFLGGLAIALVCLVLPETAMKIAFAAILAVMVILPCIYSYRLFKAKKQLNNQL